MTRLWRPKEIAGVPDGLILFDGVCVLCSGWVRFLLERDPGETFRFTPIQSPYGHRLAEALGVNPLAPESNAVIFAGRAYFKFDSVMQALARLPRWRWVRAFTILPRPVRDWLYDRIAKNRYRLFGRTESCMVPTPDVMRRFILNDPDRSSGANEQAGAAVTL